MRITLTPRLVASGNKQKMLSISKRCDRYVRKQVIHSAQAILIFAPKRLNLKSIDQTLNVSKDANDGNDQLKIYVV